jgi:hypothetical protein
LLRPLIGPARVLLIVLLLIAGGSMEVHAGKRTVCTITVNSADERETFRQRLPEDEYQFVELVERGRRDWLRLGLPAGRSLRLLVISGHFDSGPSSTPTAWPCANLWQSPRWSARPAASPVPDCSRN